MTDRRDRKDRPDRLDRINPIDRTQGTVVVFRILLLPPSETFIATQAAAMQQFCPFFVGWRKWAGIDLPRKTRWTIDNGGLLGKLRELRFRYSGPTQAELKRLKALDVRLVYAHFAPDGHAAMQLATQLDVPLVTALHGYDVTTNDHVMGATRLGREYLKGREALQKQGALFLCCSNFIRQRALALGYPADRTIVHAIGVDVERFRPPEVRERKNIILFVGRMIEKKGCASLIEAMVAVQRSNPAAELVLIGDGHLRAGYEALAMQRGVRCRFLGVQRSAVIREWMARASVFCVPSVVAVSGDAEGLGMVFIEAQAMGLPVVSTLSGGIPEAVKHGETGLLVTEHDARGLSDAILLLMQDEELWHRYSLAGRRHVVDQFNLTKQTSRLEQVFQQLLSRPHPPPLKVHPPRQAYDRRGWPHS